MINDIIHDHFSGSPNLISLDTEGTEREVLETFDFGRFRPEIFCVETLKYTNERITSKPADTLDLMASNDYFLFADTWINSIFVDKRAWNRFRFKDGGPKNTGEAVAFYLAEGQRRRSGSVMKVVILAGGLGTRLAEETIVRPKPMVEIGGRPILWHIMKLYSAMD